MKKSCNDVLAWLSFVTFSIIILSSCAPNHEAEIRELHRQYMEASMNHDTETLSTLTAEDIVWQLGPFTLQGKEKALGPHRYDAGSDCTFEYGNVVVRGDTVEFVLDEKNEIITAVGMEKMRSFPRFVFKDGLVYRKEEWKPSGDRETYNQLAEPMRNWIRAEHPDAIKSLFDSDGNWVFSRQTGELMVQLARQWQEEKEKERETEQ